MKKYNKTLGDQTGRLTAEESLCNPQHGTCTCREQWHDMVCRPAGGVRISAAGGVQLQSHLHLLVQAIVENEGVGES